MNGAQAPDIGRQLEDVVYMELRRRYLVVCAGSYRGCEVDFTASNGDVTEYFQVSQTITSEDARAPGVPSSSEDPGQLPQGDPHAGPLLARVV